MNDVTNFGAQIRKRSEQTRKKELNLFWKTSHHGRIFVIIIDIDKHITDSYKQNGWP